MCNTANIGVLRLFCAEHVVDEVYEPLEGRAIDKGLDPDEALRIWESDYSAEELVERLRFDAAMAHGEAKVRGRSCERSAAFRGVSREISGWDGARPIRN